MPFINDLDRTPFDEISKGVHDFSEDELSRLRRASEEVRAALKSANERHQKPMGASA